jgi:CBS domain-containing protein
MGSVKSILDNKGYAVFSVEPTITVFHAIELMCEKNIGGLLIVKNNQLVGIFTERDYARKLILKGKSSRDTLIGELMTANPFTVSTKSSIEDCMQIMSDRHFRHLPVVDDGKLVGMISIGDVVRQVINDQKSVIEHLQQYIAQ